MTQSEQCARTDIYNRSRIIDYRADPWTGYSVQIQEYDTRKTRCGQLDDHFSYETANSSGVKLGALRCARAWRAPSRHARVSCLIFGNNLCSFIEVRCNSE